MRSTRPVCAAHELCTLQTTLLHGAGRSAKDPELERKHVVEKCANGRRQAALAAEDSGDPDEDEKNLNKLKQLREDNAAALEKKQQELAEVEENPKNKKQIEDMQNKLQ